MSAKTPSNYLESPNQDEDYYKQNQNVHYRRSDNYPPLSPSNNRQYLGMCGSGYNEPPLGGRKSSSFDARPSGSLSNSHNGTMSPLSPNSISPCEGGGHRRGGSYSDDKGPMMVNNDYSRSQFNYNSISTTTSRVGGGGGVRTPRFSDLGAATPRRSLAFQRGRSIGAGGFGIVFQAILSDGTLAAVKQLKVDSENLKSIDREIHTMSNLPPHPNCVRYFGSRHSQQHYYIIMEFISGGSIQTLRQQIGQFRESVFQRYAYMTLLGLEHLHNHGIIHRDIKGGNVLLDERGCAKIVDFGCCKVLNELHSTIGGGGTPLWMAPEVCRGEPADEKADVWSYGCLCLEMTNKSGLPWDFPSGMTLPGVAYAIACAQKPPQIPENLTNLAKDFISCCLSLDPEERPTVQELLDHPFFDQDYPSDEDDEADFQEAVDSSTRQSAVKRMCGNPLLNGGDGQSPHKKEANALTNSKVNMQKRVVSTNAGFQLSTVDEDEESEEKTDTKPSGDSSARLAQAGSQNSIHGGFKLMLGEDDEEKGSPSITHVVNRGKLPSSGDEGTPQVSTTNGTEGDGDEQKYASFLYEVINKMQDSSNKEDSFDKSLSHTGGSTDLAFSVSRAKLQLKEDRSTDSDSDSGSDSDPAAHSSKTITSMESSEVYSKIKAPPPPVLGETKAPNHRLSTSSTEPKTENFDSVVKASRRSESRNGSASSPPATAPDTKPSEPPREDLRDTEKENSVKPNKPASVNGRTSTQTTPPPGSSATSTKVLSSTEIGVRSGDGRNGKMQSLVVHNNPEPTKLTLTKPLEKHVDPNKEDDLHPEELVWVSGAGCSINKEGLSQRDMDVILGINPNSAPPSSNRIIKRRPSSGSPNTKKTAETKEKKSSRFFGKK